MAGFSKSAAGTEGKVASPTASAKARSAARRAAENASRPPPRNPRAEGARRTSARPAAELKVPVAAALPARQEVRMVNVTAHHDGQRLDNFLVRELPGVPKSHLYRVIRSGQVRVDGGRVKPERRLSAGETVRIPPLRLPEPGEVVRPPSRILNELRASVIFEDEHYLALNKPHGLSAHGGTGQVFGVIEAIRAWNQYEYVELCHRLDRETSGVLLLAKSRPALLRAQGAFKDHNITKRYFSLLVGQWKGEDRDVDASLVKQRLGEEHRIAIAEDGKPSKSRFSPRARYRDASLCEVEIFTGRTHQIRVHALATGHPVAGDGKYGDKDANAALKALGLKRMFLHSHYLELPASGHLPRLVLNAPLPDELRDFLELLAPYTKGATGKRRPR